jgi:hypothetical protein
MGLETYGRSLVNGERSGIKLLRFNLLLACSWMGLGKPGESSIRIAGRTSET